MNNCPFGVTAFARHGSSATNSYKLAAGGGKQTLNVGSSFPAGLVFASKTGDENTAHATLLEITVGANGHDFYDISVVNAYNLPASIQPFNIAVEAPDGKGCSTPTCTIHNLQTFCKSPNAYHGDYCTNTAGPGSSVTASTKAFKSACPDAYSYSKDDASSTYSCKTGTDYNFIFCPTGQV
ncbi:hypothetical protein WJX84_001396 [Apatococcus fuscideae]|uniref:Thaumatin-like protein n=1 Tax=Apatococcus fuscideae TaxID=2026836 RepID=A0AAW1TIB2_9CHLO